MSSSHDSLDQPRGRPPAWPVAAFVGGLALFDAGIALFTQWIEPRSEIWNFVLVALIVSQPAILAIWLVWNPRPTLVRMGLHWAVLMGLAFCFAGGVMATRPSEFLDLRAALARLVLLAAVPGSLAIQAPLWILRLYFGWRIERPADSPPADRPLSISDILIGTALAALALCLLRFVPVEAESLTAGYWQMTAIVELVTAGVSLVSIPPLLYFCLRIVNWRWSVGLVVSCALLAWAAIAALAHAQSVSVTVDVSCGQLAGVSALTAMLAGPLYVARARGLRLTFPRDRKKGVRLNINEA